MNYPQSIRSILEKTIKALEIEAPLRTYSIMGAWKEIVGEPVAIHSQPYSIRNRILFVEVSHPIWMQQLQFLKLTLLEKVNHFLGEPLIQDIRFKVGKIASAPLPPPSEERKLNVKGLDNETINRIERLVENIPDAELKKGFRELLIKSVKLERSRKKSG